MPQPPGPPVPAPHPRALEPATLSVTVVVAVGAAVVGMQLVTTLGVTPNTSIVGVVLAIALSRLPGLGGFRSIHRQNLLQTSTSSATFGAANSLLVPVGVPILLGMPELAVPMLVGATLGMLIDLAMLYWLFDTRLFPAREPWPIGIASAEAIRAGDEGGRRAGLLGLGGLVGVLGSSGLFGGLRALTGVGALPMAALALAFLGNAWALALFGIGLLVRGHGELLLHLDFQRGLIPHGFMVGAGLVALGQAVALILRREHRGSEGAPAAPGGKGGAPTRSAREGRRGLGRGFALYLVASVVLALVGGLAGDLSPAALGAWAVFAAVACVAAEVIVGLSAMHAGWFPAFATALVFLLLGLVAGFPPEASALLVGFVASGGPAFADAGYDLKTGWILRGRGTEPDRELEGRRQQVIAALVGLAVALAMVTLFHRRYFEAGLFPPMARVYEAAIGAGLDGVAARSLLIWAVPGALLQLAGGTSRQLGILFATGLLIVNPLAGWAVLAGLVIRGLWARRHPDPSGRTVLAGGVIAGDALWGFGAALLG